MDKKAESSSSEDEIYMEAIKEAADEDLLTNLLLQAEGKKSNTQNSTLVPDEVNLNKDQYSTYGLTQSCRDFIAKKLVDKLNIDIVLEDTETPSNNRKNVSQKSSGIRLLSCSNTILTELIDDDEPKTKYRKKLLHTFDEKTNLLKCKEVALDSQIILSQYDLKYWVNRKHGQVFKYKKSKNGVLLHVK